MKENLKYEVIKRLVELNGNKNNAAIKLGLNRRQIDRLIKVYKEKGKSGFVHGNRGKTSSKRINDVIRNTIASLFIEKYPDATHKHFTEILATHHGINLSYACVRNILLEKHLISIRTKRNTKKKIKKIIKENLKSNISKKEHNSIIHKLETLENNKTNFPKRSKSKYMGELIQMDASFFDCFGTGVKYALHLAIDDATNTVVGAYLDTQETLKGYYQVLQQILTNYGIPNCLITDRRTVFYSKNKDNDEEIQKTSNGTNFSYACSQLGIELKTTSNPQSKGLIEKLNDTFQLRLPVDMRIAGIKNIEDTNKFLIDYIKKFNKMFALRFNDTKNCFEKQINLDLNVILGVYNERVINNDNSFKYKNNSYFLMNEKYEVVLARPKSKILVIEALNGEIYASFDENMYSVKIIDKNAKISRNFDIEEYKKEKNKKKEKKKYIPPLSHPWKRDSFRKYLEKKVPRIY